MNSLIQQLEVGYSLSLHWSVLALAVLLIVLFVSFLYRRERGSLSLSGRAVLISLRVVILLVVLLGLLDWQMKTKRFRKPNLVLLFDDSASLHQMDAMDQAEVMIARLQELQLELPTRLNILKSSVASESHLWQSLSKKFEIVCGKFGDSLEWSDPVNQDLIETVMNLKGESLQTQINLAVKSVFQQRSGRSTAAVVLFTDGLDSKDPELRLARQSGRTELTPIFVVGLGNSRSANDFSIDEVTVADRAFLNDLVEFEVRVSANGLDNRSTNLRLVDRQTGKVLVDKRVDVQGQDYRERFRLRTRLADPGKREFLVTAEQIESEFDVTNNKAIALVEVRNDPIRVLLVSEYPSREFHYLKQFLGRNANDDRNPTGEFSLNRIDLDTYLQQSDVEYASTDRHALRLFPVNKKELLEYDVIIFGDVKPGWLGQSGGGVGQSELQNIHEFVDRGGGLILLAGAKHNPDSYVESPIRDLYPISLQDLISPSGDDLQTEYRWRPSSLGRGFLAMDLNLDDENGSGYEEYPGGYWFRTNSVVKPGARVLADIEHLGQSLPAIVLQRFGNGSVLYHAMPETYRWRFREGDRYFGRYWSQMIQYMASRKLATQQQGFRIETDRRRYFRGDSIRFYLTAYDRKQLVNDDQATVLIRSTSGREKRVVLNGIAESEGRFEGSVQGLSPGSYVADVLGVDGVFSVDRVFGVDRVQTSFEIAEISQENKRRPINQNFMEILAQQTGGDYIPVEDLSQLDGRLPRVDPIEVGGDPPWIFWQHWRFTSMMGGLLLGLLTIEWIIRKKYGML